MKLLHITASYKPAYIYGGPIYSVATLCEELVAAGHEVTVYTTTANGSNELQCEYEKDLKGVKVYYFKRITKDHSHLSPTLIIHLWKTVRNYDAIHIHSWWNLVSILSMVICLMRNVTPILSPRGMLSDYTINSSKLKRSFLKFLGKHLIKKARFHATSEAEFYEIKRHLPSATCEVIFNLVNFEKLEPLKSYQNDRIKLLFISRIDPKKGLEVLFKGLSLVSFDYTLTIAGTGEEAYLKSLQDQAVKLNIAKKIIWLGSVHADKFRLFAAHELLVLISYNENFANVVIEALSQGTPVLISDQVGLSSYVGDKKMGWTTSLDPEEIAAALTSIYDSPDQRSEVRLKAPGIIRNDFAAGKLLEQYIELYKRHEHT